MSVICRKSFQTSTHFTITCTMADNTHANGAGVGYDPATTLIDLREADGRTQDEVFRTVGKQVEGLRLNRDDEDEEPKLLEEIESLCMNCEENVRHRCNY